MKNSLFRRYFAVIAGIVLISFTLLTVAFFLLSYRYTVKDRKANILNNMMNVASVATEAMFEDGAMEDGRFLTYLSSVSYILDSDVLVCSTDGEILSMFSEVLSESETEVSAVSDDVVEKLLEDGTYSGMTTLGIYPARYYVAGMAITPPDGEDNDPQALVFVASNIGDLIALWTDVISLFFFTVIVVLIIAFISSSLLALQQTKPLKDMTDVVRRFGQGEYQLRADSFGRKDEVGELARAFNSMANSIASSEERRQEFIANISHELKTPLTTISGFTEGILDGTIPPEKTEQSLQVVASETRRLSRLVHRMLDVSQIQAQSDTRSHVEFDLTDLFAQVIISLEGKLTSRGVDLDVRFPDDPLMVWGDPDGITQVCYNLLDNAAKFADPGNVISINLSAKGGKAHVSIKDQGATIPADELPMIFDRFHKSDRSRSMDKEGVGLGLYIVKTILDQHRESIQVTSENGITEFSFTLTLAD